MTPRRWTLLALLLIFLALRSYGLLVPVTLEDFFEQVECAYIVAVIDVQDVSGEEISQPGTSSFYNVKVRLEATPLADAGCEGDQGRSRILLVATEIHSSHPEAGERAVLFPKEEDGHWVEAWYGRSYWRVIEMESREYVEIDWRNEFLLKTFDIESGERALVPLRAVRELISRKGSLPTKSFER